MLRVSNAMNVSLVIDLSRLFWIPHPEFHLTQNIVPLIPFNEFPIFSANEHFSRVT